MRKLKLRIENLEVESFETSALREERQGTVLAHASRPAICFGTQGITGACCEITFAYSCVETNCAEVATCGICWSSVEDTCA